MWDSEVTPWNAADMGPKRDIVGEMNKAIRKRGMEIYNYVPSCQRRYARYLRFIK